MPSPLDHAERFTLMLRRETPDGLGGARVTWEPGADFDGLMRLEHSDAGRAAGKEAVGGRYAVLVRRDLDIRPLEYFMRRRDGRIFRVVSDPGERCAPEMSTLRVKAFTAADCGMGEIVHE